MFAWPRGNEEKRLTKVGKQASAYRTFKNRNVKKMKKKRDRFPTPVKEKVKRGGAATFKMEKGGGGKGATEVA